jgi:peptide/nickel transport system permease protein
MLVALPLGVLAAKRAGTWIDRTVLIVALVGISTHPIVVGLVLRTLVGARWHIVPDSGYCPLLAEHGPLADSFGSGAVPTCKGPADWATHLILPWLTFALVFVALYIRMIRARVLETLGEPYVRTARAKGAGELRVIRKHVLRNALLPILTMLGLDLGTAVGISIYVETVYGLPGLGHQTLQALIGFNGYDLPVILGVVLLVGTVIILLNLLLDLVYVVLDPTIRQQARVRVGAAGLR